MNVTILFNLYHNSLNHYLRCLCQDRLALFVDDIEQDLWLKLHQQLSIPSCHLHQLSTAEWLPLLKQMAKYDASDARSSYLREELTPNNTLLDEPTIDTTIEDCIASILTHFAPDEQPFVQYLLEGFNDKEIAFLLSKSHGSVRVFITRRNLKQRIRKQLVNAR